MKLGYTKKTDGEKLLAHFQKNEPSFAATACVFIDGSYGCLIQYQGETHIALKVNKYAPLHCNRHLVKGL